MQIFPSPNYGYSSYDPNVEIPDLRGKVVIVTGANSGIGYHTAEVLVTKGAKVYLAGRDEARCTAAIERIQNTILGNPTAGSAHWLPLDLGTPRKTKAGADAFLRLENRLDILIHNAGMQVAGYSTVSEGGLTINKVMSTNHLGSYVLTRELLPLLKRTAAEPKSDVRVIVVSSGAHKQVGKRPDFRNLQGWNQLTDDGVSQSMARYSISKLANILFVKELQSRLTAENVPITCISLHPGIVDTETPRNVFKTGFLSFAVWLWMTLLGLTPLQGAYTSLFAATSPCVKAESEKYQGAYLRPFNRLAEPSANAQDGDLAKDLWACSEEVTEICLRDSEPQTRA